MTPNLSTKRKRTFVLFDEHEIFAIGTTHH
jgi:hypothetical protein